jgi:hypothetical protein
MVAQPFAGKAAQIRSVAGLVRITDPVAVAGGIRTVGDVHGQPAGRQGRQKKE